MVEGNMIGSIMMSVGIVGMILSFLRLVYVNIDLKKELQETENSKQDWIWICDDRMEVIKEQNEIVTSMYEAIQEKDKTITKLLTTIETLSNHIESNKYENGCKEDWHWKGGC